MCFHDDHTGCFSEAIPAVQLCNLRTEHTDSYYSLIHILVISEIRLITTGDRL